MDCAVHIGVAGWGYPDWKGIVYPGGVDQLTYVSKYVDVIEINSTFYRPPEAGMSRGWLEKVKGRKGFFFTAKLHRDFTHEGTLNPLMVKEFHAGFEPMLDEGKLQFLLMQFSYAFEDNSVNRSYLRRLVEEFRGNFRVAVEVRHVSWEKEDALKYLSEQGVTVANLDYPVSANSFARTVTIGRAGYFRLHGRNAEKWFARGAGRDEIYNYDYSDEELGEVEDRMEELCKSFEKLVVIMNNHYRGGELANAIELKAMVTGEKQESPEMLVGHYPRLAKYCKAVSLF